MRVLALRAATTIAGALAIGALAPATPARGYPGGTPDYQTDVAPFCAACHSSRVEAELAGAPGDRAAKELAANKQIALIKAGEKVLGAPGYDGLSEADRATLAKQIEALDAASTVALAAPASVKPGETFTVKVTVTGGGGPVVGVGLVDAAHRWFARPAPAAGWEIVAAPAIVGPDGQPQSAWLDKRPERLGRNLSFVNVTGVASDPAKGTYPKSEVTFQLRAPGAAGSYPLAAVFLYGTEKSTPLGYVVDPKDPLQRKQIRGGFTGGSGRVLFSDVAQIAVKP
ncbi:MAG TPA: hypothetical protein VMW35_13245 [Myxococcota bacterium]|jgi:cytochrome c553|nr:hypothetical protein [Myxococcota bacterium]